jgi:vancomycin resistance protein YoaR
LREISRRGEPRAVGRHERKIARPVKRKKPLRQNKYTVRRALALALIACAFLVVMATGDYLFGGEEIRRGVHIGDVAVGGMTQAEAREAVERSASAALKQIEFGTEGFSLPGEELGVKVDAPSTIKEAYSVGREGWIGRRFADVVRSYLGGIRVDPEVEYKEEAARDAVENLAHEFYRKRQNATLRVTDDGQVKVREARNGRVLDREGTLANLDKAISDLSGEVPIAADYKKPEVTAEEVEKLKPTEVIGEYKTDFEWDPNPSRQANMKLAAGAVDNTLLAPGEVFSFNELAAPLDYEAAKTFSDGGVGYESGGGLCQVSSTLYMAAQYAGLKIVERNAHYAVLPYIRPGFDATVWFGGDGIPELDMRFKNTTGAYVLVREYVDEDGFLNAEIYGQPTGKKVEIRSEEVFEDPQRGIKWVTFKNVTKDGKVLRDGFLHADVYSYNPPVPEGMPHYETNAPRVGGWPDPTNTTGWADVE